MNKTPRYLAIVLLIITVSVRTVVAAKGPLRFDGLYFCSIPTSIGPATSYLRFFPDHVVLVSIYTGTPTLEVAHWFDRRKEKNFRYTLDGAAIRFEEKSDSNVYIYSGVISGDSIKLRVAGYEGSRSMGYVERTYKFKSTSLP